MKRIYRMMNPVKRVLQGGVALWAAACLTPSSQGAGMLVADGGFGGNLEIKEHAVNVVINNGIAVTTVDQTFVNMENRIVEALYTFPVPRGASVSNFSMWINGKEMVGEVLEKERAREIYNSYKVRKRDPGLLEQNDFRSFEMRIFPIPARGEQRVQVTYAQEMDYDNDQGKYVYPLATRTRAGQDSRVQGKFSIAFHISSVISLKEVGSPSHAKNFVTQRHTDGYWEASLEQTGGSLAEDIVLNWAIARPRTGLDLLTSATGREDGYFLMSLAVGEDLDKMDQGMDYVFVLDISGSMQHERKLPVSRQSISSFLKALDDQDRFEVMAFNIAANPLFKSLQTADAAAQTQAVAFLDSQEARGGTRLLPALRSAYQYADPDRSLNVVLVSDGMSEQNERVELMRALTERPANARVFCIGVGNDINRALLEQTAETSGGLAAFISEGDDFEAQARAFRRKLTRPAATDIQITVDGVPTYDIEPQKLPNLYHGAPIRVYGRYKQGGKAKVKVMGLINGKEFVTTQEVAFDERNPDNPEIERMWAWKRMDGLLKQADAQGNRAPVLNEVIRLGEGYSIVSEYTSFLVLENDAEYKRWNIERRNELRTSRDRAAQEKIQTAMQRMRDRVIVEIGPQPAAPESRPTSQQEASTPAAPAADRSPASSPPPARNGFDFPSFGGGGSGPVGPLLIVIAGYFSRKRRK